jgi:hypothetical protein
MTDDDPNDTKTHIFARKPKHKRQSASPLQAISMKTPVGNASADAGVTPALVRPRLESRAETRTPEHLGYLAPPADPHRARTRRVRDIVLVASLSIIVATIIALALWFAAR